MAQRHPPPPPGPKYILRDGMGPVSSIDFGLNDTLYAGTQDGWVHVWDLTINRKRTSFQVGDSVCIAVKGLLTRIVTQTKGDSVSFWNQSEGYKLHHKFDNSYIGFCKIECHEASNRVFIPRESSEIIVMNLNNYKVENTFCCQSDKLGELMVMKYSQYSSQDLLFVGYESGDIYLWNILTGTFVSQFKIDNVPMAIDFDQDSGKGVCGTESDAVSIFTVDKDFSFKPENVLALKNPGVSAVIIRPDKKIFILGCWDGNIRVYSWKSCKILGVLSEHTETINALSYSSKVVSMWGSILLAAACRDKTVSLWSFY